MKGLAIDITDNCNLRCISCQGYTTLPKKNVHYLAFELFEKQTVGQLEDWDSIQIGNTAEPTIHPDFSQYLGYLQNSFSGHLTILTNGTKLIKYADEINKAPCTINLSLDCVDSNAYAKIRYGSKLETVLRGLSMLDRNVVDVSASFTLMRSNINHFQAARDFCDEHDISMVWRPMTMRVFHTPKGMALNLDHMLECLYFFPELVKEWESKYGSGTGFVSAQPTMQSVSQCNLHSEWLFMGADGAANLCMKADHPGLSVASLEETWNSRVFTDFRASVEKDREPCQCCVYFEKCLNLSMDNPDSYFDLALSSVIPDKVASSLLSTTDSNMRIRGFLESIWEKVNVVYKEDEASKKRGVSLQSLFPDSYAIELNDLLEPQKLLESPFVCEDVTIDGLLDQLMNISMVGNFIHKMKGRTPKVLVWGTGGMYQNCWIDFIEKNPCGYDILGFVDSLEGKWGTEMSGLPVMAPQSVSNEIPDMIIIASCFQKEIKDQVHSIVPEHDDIYFFYASSLHDVNCIVQALKSYHS